MTLTQATITFLVGAAVLVPAGTLLTYCADAFAERTGLGKLFVGSILVAGATSMPELSVDISAVLKEMPDLAVGDLMGSCLINLLILAVLDWYCHSPGRAFSRASIGHALAALVSILMLSIVAIGLLTASTLGTLSLGGIGVSLFFSTAAYFWGMRLLYVDQRLAAASHPAAAEQLSPAGLPTSKMSLRVAIGGFAASAIVICVAGPFLSESAGVIADQTGLGKTFVGTTLVAFVTSLPELVASIAAIRLGAFDMAAGNVFGSNAFNMLLLLPVDAVYGGNLLAQASPIHAVTALAVVVVTTVAVIGQVYSVERRRRFIEPDALAIIGLILFTLFLVYRLGQS